MKLIKTNKTHWIHCYCYCYCCIVNNGRTRTKVMKFEKMASENSSWHEFLFIFRFNHHFVYLNNCILVLYNFIDIYSYILYRVYLYINIILYNIMQDLLLWFEFKSKTKSSFMHWFEWYGKRKLRYLWNLLNLSSHNNNYAHEIHFFEHVVQ